MDIGHDLTWSWPLLGLPEYTRPDVHWSPAEASAVIAWHREAAALETAKQQLMTPTGKAPPKVTSEHFSDDDDSFRKQTSFCGGTSHSSQATRIRKHRRKGKRSRGKLRTSRDLHDGPVRPRDRAWQFPRHQSGWPMFFALMSSFSSGTKFTKFVSEKIATVRARQGGVGSRCQAARVVVRGVTATKHER